MAPVFRQATRCPPVLRGSHVSMSPVNAQAMTTDSALTCVLDARASLGECPVWSAREQVLYWVDINEPALHRFDPRSGSDRTMAMPSAIGSFALREQGG